jgi:hypothetical protein
MEGMSSSSSAFEAKHYCQTIEKKQSDNNPVSAKLSSNESQTLHPVCRKPSFTVLIIV